MAKVKSIVKRVQLVTRQSGLIRGSFKRKHDKKRKHAAALIRMMRRPAKGPWEPKSWGPGLKNIPGNP